MLISTIYVLQSAKTNMNVEEVFFSIARDIKQRLAESDSRGAEVGFFHSLSIVFILFVSSIQIFLAFQKAIDFLHPKW